MIPVLLREIPMSTFKSFTSCVAKSGHSNVSQCHKETFKGVLSVLIAADVVSSNRLTVFTGTDIHRYTVHVIAHKLIL